jgi:hypothetical protein
MAKGMFRTVDGLVMVEYGYRQGAISRALYKAIGYRPAYENLELESASSAKRTLEIHRDTKANDVQRSYLRGQNWLRSDSKGGIVESYNQQPKTRDEIVEAYKQTLRSR